MDSVKEGFIASRTIHRYVPAGSVIHVQLRRKDEEPIKLDEYVCEIFVDEPRRPLA